MNQPFLQASGILNNDSKGAADADNASATSAAGAAEAEAGKVHDVIIIGSGPAGYTAAVYAARAELNPVVFEGVEYGGLLMQTTEVENFPGFQKGIMGPDLMEEMRAQAERFGADLRQEDVEKVDLTGEIKKVWAYGEEYQARTVILATGAAPRYLHVPGEQEMLGRGVSACATCDGFFFKDKQIAVVGGGDSAMEEADFLTKFGEVNGDNSVETLVVEDTQTREQKDVAMDAMFVAIGHDPRTTVFEGQVELQENGYVKVEEPSTRTSLPGVFAAGDLVDSHYQQAITAAGSGCRAALDAEAYLATL